MLEDVLNRYEKAGAIVQEIIETEKGNFRIIYTVEDVDIYNAMKIVENYCYDNYGTCEIKKIEEVSNE